MNVPLMIFVAIVGAVCLVGSPSAVRAYRRFRGPRIVRCPETGLGAEITLDAWHAAVTAFPGPPRIHVEKCSRWPAHEGCGVACMSEQH